MISSETLNLAAAIIGTIIGSAFLVIRNAKSSATTAVNDAVKPIQALLVETAGELQTAKNTIVALHTKLDGLETIAQTAELSKAHLEGQITALTGLLNTERQARYSDDVSRANERAKTNQKVETMQTELDTMKAEVFKLAQVNDTLAKDKAAAENRERVLTEHGRAQDAKIAGLQVERDEIRAQLDNALRRIEQLENRIKLLTAPAAPPIETPKEGAA